MKGSMKICCREQEESVARVSRFRVQGSDFSMDFRVIF